MRLAFFLQDARQWAMRRDVMLGGWAGQALYQRWLDQISVGLVSGLFDSDQSCWGEVGPTFTHADVGADGPLMTAALPWA